MSHLSYEFRGQFGYEETNENFSFKENFEEELIDELPEKIPFSSKKWNVQLHERSRFKNSSMDQKIEESRSQVLSQQDHQIDVFGNFGHWSAGVLAQQKKIYLPSENFSNQNLVNISQKIRPERFFLSWNDSQKIIRKMIVGNFKINLFSSGNLMEFSEDSSVQLRAMRWDLNQKKSGNLFGFVSEFGNEKIKISSFYSQNKNPGLAWASSNFGETYTNKTVQDLLKTENFGSHLEIKISKQARLGIFGNVQSIDSGLISNQKVNESLVLGTLGQFYFLGIKLNGVFSQVTNGVNGSNEKKFWKVQLDKKTENQKLELDFQQMDPGYFFSASSFFNAKWTQRWSLKYDFEFKKFYSNLKILSQKKIVKETHFTTQEIFSTFGFHLTPKVSLENTFRYQDPERIAVYRSYYSDGTVKSVSYTLQKKFSDRLQMIFSPRENLKARLEFITYKKIFFSNAEKNGQRLIYEIQYAPKKWVVSNLAFIYSDPDINSGQNESESVRARVKILPSPNYEVALGCQSIMRKKFATIVDVDGIEDQVEASGTQLVLMLETKIRF